MHGSRRFLLGKSTVSKLNIPIAVSGKQRMNRWGKTKKVAGEKRHAYPPTPLHREAQVNGSEKSGSVAASAWADKEMAGPTRRRGNPAPGLNDLVRSPALGCYQYSKHKIFGGATLCDADLLPVF